MALELTQDDIYELQNSKDDIKGILREIKERMRLDRSPDWMASIECALDDDHNWLGGKPSGGTFQDAIDLAAMGEAEKHDTDIDSLTHYVAREMWTGEPILETTPDGTPFWKCNRALEKVATNLLDELGRDYTTAEISEAWDDYNWTLRELRVDR